MADKTEVKSAPKSTDEIVDAWMGRFANTIMATDTDRYSFLVNRVDELKSSLKGV